MSYKGLLVLQKSLATVENNKYTFKFPRGIEFKRWRIRNVKHPSTNVRLFLHSPTLMNKTINNTLNGKGQISDIIALLTDPLHYTTDRHVLHSNTMFFKMEFYFSDGAGNIIAMNDFDILIDYEKTGGII